MDRRRYAVMATITEIRGKSLTVGELIQQLQTLDPDKQIMFSAASGDYWQTRLAYRFIADNVELMPVTWSHYHGEFAINSDPEDDDDDDYGDGVVYV
jgi:hypothetical protein